MKQSDEEKIKERLRALGYLDKPYCIVSGLERSGTSLMMQILEAGGVGTQFDFINPVDKYNENGYYELYDGKGISRLIDETFQWLGKEGYYIKITAYGLYFLPEGDYNIIFMERNMDEVINSMNKKMDKEFNTEETTRLQYELVASIKVHIENKGWNVLYMNYNDILKNPKRELKKIKKFIPEFDIEAGKTAVDRNLYHFRS